jgi:UDP:flavonoid glycosyltransferase YjiC (YdhE family)
LRVFLGAFGDAGHAFPMLALGSRLAQRGHEVTFETWERWREDVQQAGLQFVAAPEYPVFPTGEQPLKPYQAVLLATPYTRSAVAAAAPDVVVHDILTLAPALAAELEGVPVATLIPHVYPAPQAGMPPYALGARPPRTPAGWALWRALRGPLERGFALGRTELNETRSRLGLKPLERLHGGISGSLALIGTFPQLEYPRQWPRNTHVVGPLMWEPPSDGVAPPPGSDPLVLVAPSTAHDLDHRLVRFALAGLAREPVRVLAATNRRPAASAPRDLSVATSPSSSAPPAIPIPVPPNGRLVEWLSYSSSMPGSGLVITHAGHGTLVRALASGRPVVAVPHSGDMAENAARAAWAGVGVRLPWRLLSPMTLRLAVRRALSSPGLAARAAELQRWAAANDGASRAADLVEELAAARPRQ